MFKNDVEITNKAQKLIKLTAFIWNYMYADSYTRGSKRILMWEFLWLTLYLISGKFQPIWDLKFQRLYQIPPCTFSFFFLIIFVSSFGSWVKKTPVNFRLHFHPTDGVTGPANVGLSFTRARIMWKCVPASALSEFQVLGLNSTSCWIRHTVMSSCCSYSFIGSKMKKLPSRNRNKYVPEEYK